jgi:hypothetical protein
MAEQLRYEQQLQRLNLPNVDFAAEKEIARGYQQISGKLDQMSNFFMRQAEGMAKIEGAEYGAENAPTKQQIEDAKSTGVELELPGDKYSVYGRAAQNAALTAVYDDITLQAKSQILTDLTEYEKQDLDPKVLQDKFNTLIDGYAATFDNTSPALAKKFRAEMGLYAYGKVSTESSAFIKREKDQRISTYAAAADLFLDNGLRTLILGSVNQTQITDTGDTEEVATSAQTVNELIIAEKKKMLTGAISVGMSSSQVKTIADAFDARVLQIQSNLVLEEMYKQGSGNRGVFYQRVKQAIELGENSKVAQELPPSVRSAIFSAKADDRATILNTLRTGWNSIMEDTTKEISFNNAVREDAVGKATRSFSEALVLYDAETNVDNKAAQLVSMENALAVIKKQDPLNYETYKRSFDMATSGNAGSGFALRNDVNTEALFEMDMQKVNPQYDMGDVHRALLGKKITFDYYKTIVAKYNTIYDAEFKDAITRMKQELGVPADMYLDKTWLKSQEANVISAAITAMRTAKRNDLDGSFNADKWVTDNLPTLIKEQVPGQQGQDTALVTRMKGYTRRQVLQFIDAARRSNDTANLQKWESLLEETDALFNNPNFDQTRLPRWSTQ